MTSHPGSAQPARGRVPTTAPVGIIAYDPEGRCGSANAAASALLGLPRDMLLTQSLYDLNFWRDCGVFTQIQAALRGVPFRGVVPLTNAQGEFLLLDLRLDAITIGVQSGLLAVFVDLTQSQKLEGALHKSRERYRALVDGSPDFIFSLDSQGRLTAANKSLAAACECPVKKLMGKPLAEINLPSELAEKWERARQRVQRSGRALEFETSARLSDARLHVFEVTMRPTGSKEGPEAAIHTSARDVTQRWEAKKAAEASENRLWTLTEKAPVAMVLARGDRSIYANPLLLRMFGYISGAELSKRPLTEHLTAEGRVEITGKVIRMVQKGASGIAVETEAIRCDGSKFDAHIHLSQVELSDGPAIMGFITDLTERQETQEELRRSAVRLLEVVNGTVLALSSLAEHRDPYTAGHQLRVTELSCAIGAAMRLPAERLSGLRVAALLHDIGKVAVPIEILSKPGPIGEAEMQIIRKHPVAGFEILKDIAFPWPIAQMVREHHERMDGSGYPDGRVGDDILLEARIIAVADVVEAMSSHRPNRAALGMKTALAEVRRGRGQLFDRRVVNACLRVLGQGSFTFGTGAED